MKKRFVISNTPVKLPFQSTILYTFLLWGEFNIPPKKYMDWNKVPKIKELYVRPGRLKPALAFLHKSAVDLIPEMQWAKDKIKCDADIRSMCSSGFAEAFFQNNR